MLRNPKVALLTIRSVLNCRTKIDLLGYRVSHNVIQPDPERFRPLLEMKCPNSKSELRRVIGMFSYYAKWVHNF